jgi:SAM-dependent methyltransferase
MATMDLRACPACAERHGRPAGFVAGFDLQRCDACGTLYVAELPDASAAVDYDDYYHEGNLAVPAFVHDRLRALVAGFEADRSLNRWLDVGCGAGTLLDAVAAAGWQATGTEVSRGAADAVGKRGYDIRVGDLRELDLPAGAFDVVSMVEVVEHVPDAREQIQAAAGLLRPGGVLYVTTPHGRGISARLLGARWSVVAPPEHLQLFSVPGIRAALRDAGLTARTVKTQAVNPSELLAALRRKRTAVGPGSRVESGYRLNEALTSHASGTAVKRVANSALAATRLGDSIRLVAERAA